MCVSCICGAGMLIIVFIPESLHWLILNEEKNSFEATMREAAIQNGVDPPDDLDELVPHYDTKKLSLWSPLLFYPSLILLFSWVTMSWIYYGKTFVLIYSFPQKVCFHVRDQLCHPGIRTFSV